MPNLSSEISTEVTHDVHHDVSLFEHIFTPERVFGLARAAFVMGFALVFTHVARRTAARWLGPRLPAEQALLLDRAVRYTILGLAATWSLKEMGFEISVLLGAAGGVTLALGFAAQTSVSNVISGMFLIFEKPFGMGDNIDVAGVSGEVLSIDLLSIKLRTGDNLYVRVPNAMVLQSTVTNNTRFDARAFSMPVWVDGGTDLVQVQNLILDLVKKEPKCMADRSVTVVVASMDARGVQLSVTAWANRNDVAVAKSQLYVAMGTQFKQAGIAMPAPLSAWVRS